MENEFEKQGNRKIDKDTEGVERISKMQGLSKDDAGELKSFGGAFFDSQALIEAMLKNAQNQAVGKESESVALDDAHLMSEKNSQLRKLAELKRIINMYRTQTSAEKEAFAQSEDFMGIDPSFLKNISESSIKELEKRIEEKETEVNTIIRNN